MDIDGREIEETIEQLRRSGEYEKFLSEPADVEGLDFIWGLTRIVELTDAEVEQTLASVDPAPEVSDEEVEAAVDAALSRAHAVIVLPEADSALIRRD